MTTPVNDRRIQYTATAGQTIFPYDFKIDANTEITVLQTINATSVTNTLTLTTEYTVSGVGDAGGGNITLVTGASLNDTITIVGNTPLSRVTDFNQAGDFLVSDLNNQLDKITNILQENKTNTDRAVKLKDEDTTSTLEIPTATNRASKFLAFDASGNAIASAGTTETPVSSFMATVLDDINSQEALTTLSSGLTAITTLQDADQFIVADNSDSDNSKKITKANLKTALETTATTTTKGTAYLSNPITIANNATDADHDIDFGAGNFDFDDGSGQATLSALTKQFDATFALGTNAGGMVSGESLPTSGYVYLYAISNSAGTTTDIIGTTTADGSTISGDSVVSANSLTKKYYLGSFLTDASANIDQSFVNVRTSFGQVARYTTGAYSSGATAIPFDDSIPQNTEGTQFMTATFKPISATSKLKIDVCITLGAGSAGQTITALFRDSTADALAAAGSTLYSGPLITTYNFSKIVNSNSTSTTTFKVRASITTGTVQFNGVTTRKFGGTIPSSITITEILA